MSEALSAGPKAAAAYARTFRSGLSGRLLEATLLSQIAAELRSLAATATPQDMSTILRCLERNRKLWKALVDAVVDGDTDLPPSLRTKMSTIGAFVFRQTVELATTWDPAGAAALASINAEIADGLAGRG